MAAVGDFEARLEDRRVSTCPEVVQTAVLRLVVLQTSEIELRSGRNWYPLFNWAKSAFYVVLIVCFFENVACFYTPFHAFYPYTGPTLWNTIQICTHQGKKDNLVCVVVVLIAYVPIFLNHV